MKLEEAIKLLKEMKNNCIKGMMKGAIYTDKKAEVKAIAIETVLQELKNSIPKKIIEDKIEKIKDKQCFGLENAIKNSEISILKELLEDK